LPYFISSSNIKNDQETFIKLDGIESKEAARFLLKKEVWLSENDFKKFSASAAPISLLGFTIINDSAELGDVIEVIEQPHQILCTIIHNGKEIFIPIHQDFLEKMDKKNRKLYLHLPEGLLDI
jgi:16S rRNA processing protein RimM